MKRFILPLLISLATPACGPVAPPRSASKEASYRVFDGLLGLMRQRLEVMHEVARYKWARQASIEDPEREAALLREVADKGVALGLEPETTRAFFRGQIEAAKIIQRADFSRWKAKHRDPEGDVPDLAGVLRPRIDRWNRELLSELAKLKTRSLDRGDAAGIRARADQLLVGDGIDAEVRATAIAPLIKTRD